MAENKMIDEMAKELAKIQCNKKGCEDCEFYQFECDDLQHYTRIAELLYNAGYRKQKWISVDERLPDKEGTYLTYTDKDNVDLDIFCIYPSHETKFWSGERRGKVTHWMPIPEPPETKGETE